MLKKSQRLRNCPICHRLFVDTGIGICRNCYEKEREDEETVIEYVREHHQASIQEIVRDTGARYALVEKMIKRGQFMTKDNEITHPCKRCGKPIVRGMYCPQCLALIHRAIDKANAEAAKRGLPDAKKPGLRPEPRPVNFATERLSTPAKKKPDGTKSPHRGMNIWRTLDRDRDR